MRFACTDTRVSREKEREREKKKRKKTSKGREKLLQHVIILICKKTDGRIISWIAWSLFCVLLRARVLYFPFREDGFSLVLFYLASCGLCGVLAQKNNEIVNLSSIKLFTTVYCTLIRYVISNDFLLVYG